ncbi:peptidylprolyl isomerase [Aliikangiella maris]|uniref:Chaperone SurA n=2 Tax=Aliikangiella maris TaxID=3162458 RepID=A0ABV2BRI9_9GAMM
MMKKLVKLGLVTVMTFYTVFAQANLKIVDRVVALVDSDVVLASELVRRTNSIIQQIKERKQNVPELEKLKEQVLERLIVESLQLQMAKRVGVRISDTELDATLTRIAGENQLSLDEFRKQVIAEGNTWPLFREDLRNEIMISRVRNGVVSRRIQISDKEIDNLLVQINQEGESRTQYSLGHILLPLAESATPEEIAKVRATAENLVMDLRGGANFQEYAITYSAGENALSGGSLGWRSLSQLPSLFADSVRSLKTGDVTDPLRSGSGLHILKLFETKGGFESHSVMQTHVRHILITPDLITDEKAALDKINLVRQRILDGEKFEDLAIEFSDDKGTAALGGDLKWSDPGTFVPEFNEVMNSLAINELSQPVKTEFGWHIIEVLGRRDKDQTEEKKRETAYRILQKRKFEEEAQLWLRELKDQAYIRIVDEK